MHLGFVLRLLCILQVIQLRTIAATSIGIIYDEEDAVAPGGAEVAVQSLRAQGISKVRLYNADSAMLRALGGSSIEVIVGLRNDELFDVGVSRTSADSWVARNVEAYFPGTQITAIAVGNEILTGEDESLVSLLVPAMRNIHAALCAAGLGEKIKVSTPLSFRLVSTFSSPSAASFDHSPSTPLLLPVLDFLSTSGSYVMLILNPCDVKQPNPSDLTVSHAVYYPDSFEALIDAVYVAMASLGHPELDIAVTEVALSRDCSDNDAAAVAFREDVVKQVLSTSGTPYKPRVGAIDLYMAIMHAKVIAATSSESPADSGVRRKLLADKSWCVAKDGSSTADLQAALDWACGPGGANCQPIQAGQFCFLPNTMQSHASYAFNSYYQKLSWASGSCDFGGLAQIVTNDPSYTGCLYPSSGTYSDPTNTTFNPPASDAQSYRYFSPPLLALVLLISWKLTAAW
ncbi:hypothetical protein R1flu_015095 [Riccia fluitans]|uniref:X8 domain-containing protein n=1 Tax=Riccia fluitans TaxID=41844 RepID=A0ABD1YHY9_9MARC